MLVFAVNMIATKQPASSLWGIPLTLFGTLCWAGPITGGHMNPAVSLAVLIQHIDIHREHYLVLCYGDCPVYWRHARPRFLYLRRP